MRRHDNGRGAAHLGQLLHAHGVGEHVAAGAAVLLGEIDAQHAQLAHLFHRFGREALLFVQLLSQRLYFRLSKLTIHLAKHLLLICQMKIHTIHS